MTVSDRRTAPLRLALALFAPACGSDDAPPEEGAADSGTTGAIATDDGDGDGDGDTGEPEPGPSDSSGGDAGQTSDADSTSSRSTTRTRPTR